MGVSGIWNGFDSDLRIQGVHKMQSRFEAIPICPYPGWYLLGDHTAADYCICAGFAK